jgi:IclR family acetate operon transcriptional repressor
MTSPLMTLEVLEIIAEHQPVAVAEVAALVGRPKSTAQRALLTLHQGGWIRPHGWDRTRWVLTPRVVEVARRVGNDTGLRDAARPVLEWLRQTTGESVELSLRDGNECVAVEFLEGSQAVRFVRDRGVRRPLHAGSAGKAILANLEPAEIDDYLSRPLERLTPRTITSPRTLRTELKRIRAQGFAVGRAEVTTDVASVTAAILSPTNRPLAGISVGAPLSRLSDDAAALALAPHVVKAAASISDALVGYSR